eukprot:1156299-Pelagomonas_calceolata.AAC.9
MFKQAFPGRTPWPPLGTSWLCRVAQIRSAGGPAYSELVGFIGARTQIYMTDLTLRWLAYRGFPIIPGLAPMAHRSHTRRPRSKCGQERLLF